MTESKVDFKSNQITEGVIWKQMLLFFVPIALGTLVQQLYNVADAAIVGRFVGKEALASVGGSAAMLVNMVIYFFSGLSAGAAVIIAQFFGAKNAKSLHTGIHTAYAFAVIASVILAIVGWIFTPALLEIMNTPAEILADSILYMRIFFGGLIATLIYNMGSAIMRAVGDSKRPLYYLVVCSVLNIFLDLVFVVIFHMGIAGAAIATVISQTVSAVLVTYSLMNAYEEFSLQMREIRLNLRMLWMEVRVGLPGGIQFCIGGFTGMVIQSAINGFGTDTAAAWAAYNKIDMIFWTLCGAFGTTITTFVGQNLGAKKYDRMFKSIRVCIGLALLICGAAQVCLYVFCEPMFRAFTSDETVIEIGVYMMRYLVPVYIFFIFSEIPTGALRGMGDAAPATIFNLLGTVFLKVPWIFIVLPKYPTIETILLSYPISATFSMILVIVYYINKKKKIKCSINNE